MLDMAVVENAIAFDEKSKASLMLAMQNITIAILLNNAISLQE